MPLLRRNLSATNPLRSWALDPSLQQRILAVVWRPQVLLTLLSWSLRFSLVVVYDGLPEILDLPDALECAFVSAARNITVPHAQAELKSYRKAMARFDCDLWY
jgi:hypothetical protein